MWTSKSTVSLSFSGLMRVDIPNVLKLVQRLNALNAKQRTSTDKWQKKGAALDQGSAKSADAPIRREPSKQRMIQ